ncbi:uncharacterized protein Z518_11279 [Rhinocladiella mackenziei CBS 650.93]|uniref:FAD/NAD(P)-binding domain-containing protein n=1 Tax=Rhinocladiella mackenziei CBS 650.93 TaxID=1442369 RepID=A0A0D2I8K9_9EURO|nr:uncharacterized protein Z518_11279 [Rhinocladiella mackenziei CBS 650.93]KIW99540.1 hypothetical protein Z518_11279 [Rhinocladiella mackenziei CBS 650.93]
MSSPTHVIVIGAGLAGLVAAKTYLQVSKQLGRPIDLVILDNASGPGGIWANDRLYPGLMLQGPNGFYEMSDFSMVDDEHPRYSLVAGPRVQAYLEAYARKFDVYDKIRFSTTVVKARRRVPPSPPGWTVLTSAGEILECHKLIVATGLYSTPRAIPLPADHYKGTSIHSRDLGKMHENISEDPTVKDVVVVGGCKSAVEACAAFLASEKRVHWLVRPSEQGAPMLILDLEARPNPLEISLTRLLSAFSSSPWNTNGFWYRFLHSGSWSLGTWLVNTVSNLMTNVVWKDAHYDKSQNTRKLEPKRKSIYFYIPYLSTINKGHPFLEALQEDNPEKVTVYRAKPLRLEGREVVIDEEGEGQRRLPADAVIWSIGWEPGLDYFEPEEASRLGLPVPTHPSSTSINKCRETSTMANGELRTRATVTPVTSSLPSRDFYDRQIRALFPATLNQTPAQPQDPATALAHTRWGLYRLTIPSQHFATGDRTLMFAGLISSAQTALTSELSALWGIAWLEDLFVQPPMPLLDHADADRLTIPSPLGPNSKNTKTCSSLSPEDLKLLADAEICMGQAYQERRYGLRGASSPSLLTEAQNYLDLLCQDLGIDWQRKRTRMRQRDGGVVPMEKIGWLQWMKGWWWEYLEPYGAADYRGIIDEFLRNREQKLKTKEWILGRGQAEGGKRSRDPLSSTLE